MPHMQRISAGPLVSCLCVTEARPGMLKRAIACFRAQTYERRELVVVSPAGDLATSTAVEQYGDPRVRIEVVDPARVPTLGDRRNHSVTAARGELVATWDDDDWSDPDRLAAQVEALRGSGRDAVTLSRVTIYDQAARRAYLTPQWPWECTLVARREALPPFPSLPRGEDTPVVQSLRDAGRLTWIDAPQLYIYVRHGHNTSPSDHWTNRLLPISQPLGPEPTARVERALASYDGQPATRET